MRFGLIGYGLWGRHHATRDPQGARRGRWPPSPAAARRRRRRRGATSPTCRCTSTTGSCWRAPTWTWPTSWCPTTCTRRSASPPSTRGKDVLLEKPMAATAGRSATGSSRRPAGAGGSSASATSCGSRTQWGTVKAIIDAGDIGEPMYAVHTLFRFPYRPGAERLASRPIARRLLDPRGAGPRLRLPDVVPRAPRRPRVGPGPRQRPATPRKAWRTTSPRSCASAAAPTPSSPRRWPPSSTTT